jgi:pimeloyl-ACP methyl ester carboxylesterase
MAQLRRRETVRWLQRALLILAALCAALALGSSAAIAHPGRGASAPKPTIVFVHGAWADASGFATEINTLSRLGYPVMTVANPLRGLLSDAAYVRARLEMIGGPIVLIGHSYGGAVITNAADGVPNVKALVYLGAFSLAQGESVATVLPPAQYPGSHLDPTKLDVIPVANPVAPGGQDVDLYIKSQYFRDIFAGDVSPQKAVLEATTQRPLANFAYTEPSGVPAWQSIPSWNLITLDDHAISPLGQKFMAGRMHAHTEYVHSAHDVMISHPAAVDRIVIQAAAAVS